MKIYILGIIITLFSVNGISQSYDYKRKYTDPNRSGEDLFSFAVDVDGDYLVSTNSGDFEDLNELNPLDSAGSALIYKKINNEWVLNQKISTNDRQAGDAFGTAVRMQGDELFLSSVFNPLDSLGNNPIVGTGAVYVYKRNNQGQYLSVQKLTAFDRDNDENFGVSLDVHGEWLVIGSLYEDKDANGGVPPVGDEPGAAYVFRKNLGNGNWDYFQKLTSISRNDLDRFGFACAVYNNQIAIGAYTQDYDVSETTFVANSGAVYTYSFDGTSWVYQQKLVRASRTEGDNFGYALDIHEDKLVVGAPFKILNGGNNNQGAINIYNLIGNTWVSNQPSIVYPKSLGSFPNDFNRIGAFGATITMKSNSLFVSAPGESVFVPSPAIISYGAVYRYDLNGGVYTLTEEYVAPEKHDYGIFGFPLAVDSNVLVIGAPGDIKDSLDQGAILDSAGAFYIFEQCFQANIPTLTSMSTSICGGDSVQIVVNSSADLNSAEDWFWYTGTYGGGTLVDSTDTVWVSPTTTTTYSVAGEGGCVLAGASDSVGTITITVNPSPTVSINANPSTTICSGESITLSGSGASSYVWDNGVVDGTSFIPASTTTYKVVGTDGSGCKDSTTQLITVNTGPLTSIVYTDPNPICSGTSITLSGAGATTYTWDNGVADGVAFTPSVTTTYTVTGDNGTGCTSTADTTITVIAGPSVSLNTVVTTVCSGQQVNLTASGGNTYSWDNGLGAGQSHTVTPTVTTKYIVTGFQMGTGCLDKDSVTITVNPLPIVVGNAAANDSLCLGDDLTLTGSGANSYTWDNGVTDGVTFIPGIGSVDYEVTGTDVNSCVNTAIINVKVFNQPTITASVSPTDPTCSGEQVTLTAFGGVSYDWGISGGVSIINGVPFVPPSGNNTFTVIGTDANGCSGSAVQSVTVNPSPTVGAFSSAAGQSLCEGDSVQLTGTGSAQSYSWDNNIANNIFFKPSIGTTVYTVTGVSGNLCEATASISITVNSQEDASITPLLPLCGGVPIQNLVSVTPGGTWQGVGVDPSSGAFDASIAGEGLHEIIYTTSGACNDADTTYIEVYPELIINAVIDSVCFGDSDGNIGVEVIQGVAPYSYLWETGETTSVLSNLEEGIYVIEVRDANNCIEEADVAVFLTENCDYHEFLPNVFSPNGDGVNDVFYVRGKGFESLSLVVFDRWGNKLFETTDKDIGWDGTNKGSKISSDVYIYHLEGKYFSGETFEKDGNVLLSY